MTSREYPIDPDSPGWRPYVAAHDIGMPPWAGFGCELPSCCFARFARSALARLVEIGEDSSPSLNCSTYDQASLTFCHTVGINRFVQGLLGLADVRETVLFPRDACRLSP